MRKDARDEGIDIDRDNQEMAREERMSGIKKGEKVREMVRQEP